MELMNGIRKRKYSLLAGLFIAVFVILFLWPYIAISIKPGQAGVFYSRLFGGTDKRHVYNEGVHFIAPWDIIYIYDIRLQEYTETFKMLSQDGLTIEITASIRYQVIPERLPELHTRIGPEYERIIISPTFTSAIRKSIGNYRPDELYASARQEIQDNALIEAVNEVSRLPVLINSIVIKRLALPAKINASIESKLAEEQESLKYQYVLKRTLQEVKRLALEAEGIRLYQKAINEGMTDNFLRFEGINATKALAQSPNAKMVVVGGKDGLPLILNPDGGPKPEAGAQEARKEPVAASAPATNAAGPEFTVPQKFEVVKKRLGELWDQLDQTRLSNDASE